MKKVFILFLVMGSLVGTAQKEPTDYTDAIRLIDAWADAQKDYQHLPGLSAAIVNNQEVLWSKGYGMANTTAKVPTTTSTIYSICSISKLFTSIAIMQLYDAGKLRLDDSIESLLPDFKIKNSYSDAFSCKIARRVS